tara:strand:- start:880 stop:1629 length:750 start_codon:yes stop_codon:yes gene_type:complete
MYKYKLIIDSREVSLYNNIIERDLDKYKNDILIEYLNLELGDIHIIIYEDDVIKRTLIFERKTLKDLLSSINDGRYREQKMRLLSNNVSNNITYIIEGDDIISNKINNNNTLTSVYMNILYRDNMNLVFTKNITDTATFILTLCVKIIDKPLNYINNINIIPEYVDCIKLKSRKINNITPQNCFIMQLSQIPNISSTISKNIAKKFSTLKKLIYALDSCNNEDEMIKLLMSIDKIGKDKAYKILSYLQL